MRGMTGKGTLLLLTMLLAGPAVAGSVYRCEGGDGVSSYSSKRVPGAKCRLVGSFRPERASARTPQPVAVAPASVGTAAVTAEPPKAVPVAATSAPVPMPAASGAPRLVRGQVYSYIGKDGVRTYTSARPRGVAAASLRTIKYSYMETCYACGSRPGVNFRTLRLNTTAYQNEIRAAAQAHGVEEAVIRAIIHAESAFNPNALSRVGAQGLMQLMPATARRFGVGNAFDASQNISGGVQYLAWLLKRFNGNLTLAAAGYNAGEGAVDRHGGVPPYSETRHYVERVAILADRYRGVLNPVASPVQGGLSVR
ncbi:MAG: lytic transglycosylase domain-containing protein [Thermomonas sp.]|uniref:lytic transglycosylase domain-containing protein n=1 Tax=Thermomonas sp. TaxID=1971895 RepID=UPI0039E4AEC4